MAELLGICTRYQQTEVAHAAVCLAEHAQATGFDVSLRADRVCLREVTPYWDARVHRANKDELLDWFDRCDRVLWTRCPDLVDIELAHNAGVEVWILAVWDELAPEDIPALVAADRIICPYACTAEALLRRNTDMERISLPWVVPVPVSPHSGVESPRLRVALPLFDSQPRRNDSSVFTLVHDLLIRVPHMDLTLGQGHGWSPGSRRALKELRRLHGPRITVVQHPKYLQRISFFAQADLTLWPSRYEGLALMGLWSTTVGTPVVAWDVQPQAEYLRHLRNSYLVPCELETNWLGVPEAVPQYEIFLEHTASLLHDRALLGRIQQSAVDGAADRKARFAIGWQTLLQGGPSHA